MSCTLLLEFTDILRTEFTAKLNNKANNWDVSLNLAGFQKMQAEANADSEKAFEFSDERHNQNNKRKGSHQVKVENERLESIFNTIGEVVILKNQLQEYFSKANDISTSNLSESLNLLVKDLYEKALGLRLTSIKPLFQRLQRTMRDLSIQLNKDIQINMHGDDIEIDRSFFEVLAEPLIHLVRNAIDHGIETKAVRLAKCKPETAVVDLKGYYQNGQIVIEIKDDGKGFSGDLTQLGSKLLKSKSDKGNGLGLFLTQDLIERMNGEIHFVKSEQGFLVHILLPESHHV